jgi:signal transduction histidine kinase
VASDLAQVIAQVVDAAGQQAQSAGVTLFTDTDASVGAVRGDRVSLGTIVSNLVSNAVKYNRVGGRVTVRAARDGEMAVVEVTDTGFGIPDEALPELFREFYRVKNDRTRDIPGTGLGLAICKRIVTDLDGTIGVTSRKDEGTTFVVRLPISAKAAPRDAGAR